MKLPVFMLSIALSHICANAAAAADAQRSAAKFVEQGNQHLKDEQYIEALGAFDKAREKQPASAEVAYNRGVALYRLGRNQEAETAFQDALRPDQPELEASAKFNLGRCAHATAMADLTDMEKSINDLSRAIGFYKDALQLRPDDKDAEHNIAQAQRLQQYLKKKLELQKQQQEPQPSSQPGEKSEDENQEKGDDQQEGEDQQQGENSESQQNENQNREDEESTTQPSPSSQPEKGDENKNEDESTSRPASQPEMKPPQPETQPTSQPDEQSKTQPEMQPSSQPTTQPESEEDIKMRISREQALRMLQEARDAERKRREEKRKAKLRRSGRIPVDKDW
ncbi:MAG: tetratricopeptide repeat protein [Phycisphaerales bacterium]|nr:tetratricopeptide repeat protein [Phycisphaerales bacterium]